MKKILAIISLGLLSLCISSKLSAQCATGIGPTYASGCTSQYFTSITASGAGVVSTISYTGTSCAGTFFDNFATQGVTAPTGSVVNINVSRLASYYAYLAVYVDWNNNGIYETTELVGSVITMPAGTPSTVYSFTIPLIGITTNTNLHMRVFLGEPPSAGGALSTINPPCSAKWGESCDYYINATCTGPTISVSPASPSVCGPTGTVTLTASGAGLTPTYLWSPATGLSATTGSSVTATPGVTSTYTITGYGPGVCLATIPVTVTVNPIVSPVITASGPTTICTGNSITLSETSGTGSFYQWYNGATPIAGATNSSYVASPSITTTYSVVVTNVAGCTGNSATIITVVANPVPVITPGGPTTFCAGGSVTLTETSGTGSSYQWYNGSAPISGATTGSYTAAPTTTTTYSVTATNGTGCTGTTSITITILPAPVPVITPAGPTTFCAGGSITLTETSGTGSFYQWYNGATLIPGATNNTYVASPPATTTYSVFATNASGCTGSASITVTILPLPIAVITPAGPTTVCAPGTVLLNANFAPGYTYVWLNSGGIISGATAQSYTASVTDGYKVAITTAGGCKDTSVVTNVIINPQPVALAYASGPLTFCAYDSVVLTAVATMGYTYQWLDAITIIPGATNISYTATVIGTHDYRVIVTNTFGCSDTTVSGLFTVVVNPTPVSAITASGPLSFCSGGSVTLSVPFISGYTYQWYFGTTVAGALPISGATAASYTTSTTGYYYASVITPAGCISSSVGSAVLVTNLALPYITHNTPLTFCWGSHVTLSLGISSSASGVTFQWLHGGIGIPGATSNTYDAAYSGVYTCVVNVVAGCISTTPPVSITVNTLPNPVITYGGGYLKTDTFYTSYQWYRNLTAIPGATHYRYPPVNIAIYGLIVTDTNGCLSDAVSYPLSTLDTIITTNVHQVSSYNMPVIYPNPATNKVYIQYAQNVEIIISSIDGKKILDKPSTNEIDISALPHGLYIITLYDEDHNKLLTEKLVKQ